MEFNIFAGTRRIAWICVMLTLFFLAHLEVVVAEPVLDETLVQIVRGKPRTGSKWHLLDDTHIVISGVIRESAVAKLEQALPEARRLADFTELDGTTPMVSVVLNSEGGEVIAAMKLGQLLRQNAVDVWVLDGSSCNSACVFVLAGGVTRVVSQGAHIGIHRPYYTPEEFAKLSYAESQDSYRKLSQLVRSYLSEMGIDDSLFYEMMRVESRKLNFITQEFVKAVRLDGVDPAHQEWQRAKDIQAIGKNRMDVLERNIDCINAQTPKSTCKKQLAE